MRLKTLETMHPCFALSGILLLSTISVFAAKADADVEEQMVSALAEEELVGAVWVLVTPAGRQIGAAGSRNSLTGQPMRPDDRVHIGSVTKPLIPFLGTLALLLAPLLFLSQSFLQLGDMTLASGALAAATGLLPLTMLAGLGLHLRNRPAGALARIDALAMLVVLQWTVVLAAWGLLPLRLGA